MRLSSFISLLVVVFLVGCPSGAHAFGNHIINSSKNNNNHHYHRFHVKEQNIENAVKKAIAGTVAALTIGSAVLPPSSAAWAAESRVVGQISGSGLIFKDTLTIESFEDPKVKGVTLYISNFQRPLTERLSSNFFSDPSYASVGCAKTTPTVQIADNIAKGVGGEEVFEESKSLLFKTLRVQRIYDEAKQTVVYVSFNTRLDKNEDSNKSRFKSSICAVNLE